VLRAELAEVVRQMAAIQADLRAKFRHLDAVELEAVPE
jgi:hypothetical protein